MAKIMDLTMVRGDTLAFDVRFEGLDTDLSSAAFTCKTKGTSSSSIFSKTLNSGISKVSTGVYRVRVAPADTANVAAGEYVYDLQVGLGSDIYTIILGNLKILQDATN